MSKKNKNNKTQQPPNDGDPLPILIELETASKEHGVPPEKVEGRFKEAYDLVRENAAKAVIVEVIRELIRILKQFL